MKELVVISGKGGTGKTSITASFAALAKGAVVADCDVDAADLHLILTPQVRERHEFRSGREAIIREENCSKCGLCETNCRFEAVKTQNDKEGETIFFIDPISCEGCGVCVRFCPLQAIDFVERLCGEWMISDYKYGKLVHAKLGAAAENSGKLVSTVRREAKRIAEENNTPLIIVDGPPGIGCPVIASLTGASLVLAVTEPTVSGKHDLDRVLQLTRHFNIPTAVCVNKWDVNPEVALQIEQSASDKGAQVVGRIRYDSVFTQAQVSGKAVVELETPCAEEIKSIWNQLEL